MGSAKLVLSNNEIDFGIIQLNKSVTEKITIKNEGSMKTNCNFIIPKSIPVIIRPLYCELEPDKSQTVYKLIL